MRVWPALDLLGGRAVQLEGGDPDRVVATREDPLAVAEEFRSAGADGLHVVDLDRALDRGDNLDVVRRLVEEHDVAFQVAGGLRTHRAVGELLDAGADRAVVGTRAIQDFAWYNRVVDDHPDRIVLALDVRGGRVVTEGWTEESDLTLARAAAILHRPDLAAVLCTDVDREGGGEGADPDAFRPLVERSGVPVVASGGIARLDDLDALAKAGVAEVVVGSALYTGTLDLGEVLARAATL